MGVAKFQTQGSVQIRGGGDHQQTCTSVHTYCDKRRRKFKSLLRDNKSNPDRALGPLTKVVYERRKETCETPHARARKEPSYQQPTSRGRNRQATKAPPATVSFSSTQRGRRHLRKPSLGVSAASPRASPRRFRALCTGPEPRRNTRRAEGATCATQPRLARAGRAHWRLSAAGITTPASPPVPHRASSKHQR